MRGGVARLQADAAGGDEGGHGVGEARGKQVQLVDGQFGVRVSQEGGEVGGDGQTHRQKGQGRGERRARHAHAAHAGGQKPLRAKLPAYEEARHQAPYQRGISHQVEPAGCCGGRPGSPDGVGARRPPCPDEHRRRVAARAAPGRPRRSPRVAPWTGAPHLPRSQHPGLRRPRRRRGRWSVRYGSSASG